MKKLILLSFLLVIGCGNYMEPVVCDEELTNVNGLCTLVCDEGLTVVDGKCIYLCEESVTECYYQGDLEVLQDIIDVNENLSGEEPLDIGF